MKGRHGSDRDRVDDKFQDKRSEKRYNSPSRSLMARPTNLVVNISAHDSLHPEPIRPAMDRQPNSRPLFHPPLPNPILRIQIIIIEVSQKLIICFMIQELLEEYRT